MNQTARDENTTLTDKALILGHMLECIEELDKCQQEFQENLLGISLALNRYQQFLNEELTELQEQQDE